MIDTGPYWWYVNIVSGNGVVVQQAIILANVNSDRVQYHYIVSPGHILWHNNAILLHWSGSKLAEVMNGLLPGGAKLVRH